MMPFSSVLARRSLFVNLNHILRSFEFISGFKIIRGKCLGSGINSDPSKLDSWPSLLGCEVGSFPTSYLGLDLGLRVFLFGIWLLKRFKNVSPLDREVSFLGVD